MSLEQVSIRVDSRLVKELDRIAHHRYKRRSDVIRDALVDFVEHEVELREVKQALTEQFFEGKLSFKEFAQLVGLEIAEQLEVAKETLEGSIDRAKKDSKRNS